MQRPQLVVPPLCVLSGQVMCLLSCSRQNPLSLLRHQQAPFPLWRVVGGYFELSPLPPPYFLSPKAPLSPQPPALPLPLGLQETRTGCLSGYWEEQTIRGFPVQPIRGEGLQEQTGNGSGFKGASNIAADIDGDRRNAILVAI